MFINLILRICIAGTFCSHCIRLCRSGIKFGFVLSIVLKLYVQIYQLVDCSTLIWEKLFECSSYITFPPDRICNEVHMSICNEVHMSLFKNLKVTGVFDIILFIMVTELTFIRKFSL